MKKYILILFLFLTSFVNAQDPDPDLFNQTWYLYEVNDSEGEHIFLEGFVDIFGNPVSPYVIIDEFLSFNGLGICNTFNGTLEQHPNMNYFRTVTSNVTTNSCGDPFNYEPIFIGPFGYVDPDPNFYTIIAPEITNDSDGFQTLTYGTQPFVLYTYRNTPILSTDEFKKNAFSLYPNPTKGVLNFYFENATLESVSIYSVTGTKVLQLSIDSSTSINLSSLNKGLYFVEITYLEGKEVHKIVKN